MSLNHKAYDKIILERRRAAKAEAEIARLTRIVEDLQRRLDHLMPDKSDDV